MKPARFSYEAPATLEGALAALSTHENAKIIAGGQSLAPMMNMRLAQPDLLVDINRIGGLSGMTEDGDTLVIGAMTRHADLAKSELVRRRCPILARAAETIGHHAIRQRGTIGGSLAHADPAAQLPMICILLDAEIEVASIGGRRRVAAAEFFEAVFTTALEPTEIIVAVRVPALGRADGWGFRLFRRRAGDFAEVGVAAVLKPQTEKTALRLAVGAVGPVPVRMEDAAPPAGTGHPEWSSHAAKAVADAADIEDNQRMPAAYRREILAALVEDALRDAGGCW